MSFELVQKVVSSWKKSLYRHRKTIGVAMFFGIVSAMAIAGVHPAFAAGETAPGVQTATDGISSPGFWLSLLTSIILALARLCLSLTMFALSFIIELAGYNDFLNASAVNVGWVMVRDITNMGFVVILLVIAFGTILGLEHYEWKKMLVKMVMAAILVNFSRTICGVVIDVAQVVMITFVNGIAATAGGNLIQMFNLDKIRELSTSADPKTFDNTNIFLASVGSLVFASIAMGMMLAILFMLIARMVVLWVLIVLSPLAFVLSVLPQTEEYANQWWSEFTANVITGPVLLFFIWLAFVTAGNGKVHDEIAGGSVINTADADSILGDQASGVGAAWDWNNMANFAIAIGMLMVGARAASQLGGVGGEWAGAAVDFGKKVGMYASGAMAARWAVDKGAEAGKEALKYAARPAVRLAETGLNVAKIAIGKSDEKRNAQAKAIEETVAAKKEIARLEQKQRTGGGLTEKEQAELAKQQGTVDKNKEKAGLAGKLGTLGAMIVETRGRAEKRLEDVEKAAHMQEVIVEETYSTSKSWQGQLKLDLGVREHQIEQHSEAKRAEKYAMHELKLMEKGDETFHEREGIILGARANTKAAEAQIEAKNAEQILAAEQKAKVFKYEAEKNVVQAGVESKREASVLAAEQKADVFGAKAAAERDEAGRQAVRSEQTLAAQERVPGFFAAKAVTEQVEYKTSTEREREVAKARDEYLTRNNRASEATNLQKTLDKQAKVKIEAQVVGDFISAMARSLAQLKRVQDAERALASAGNPAQAAEAAAALNQLRQGAIEMSIGNLDRHAAYAEGIQMTVLKELNKAGANIPLDSSVEIAAPALKRNQAQRLSAILNKAVSEADVEREFSSLPEELRSQIRLESEKAAGQGALSLAGLFSVETLPDGQLKTVLTKDDSDGLSYVKGRRDNALSGSKITTLAGFGGSVDKNTNGKYVVKSDESKNIVVKMVAPVTNNITSSIDEYVKADFAEILDNSGGKTQELVDELVKSAKDSRGLAQMLQFAYERMTDANQKNYVKGVIDNLNRQNRNNAGQSGAAGTPPPPQPPANP